MVARSGDATMTTTVAVMSSGVMRCLGFVRSGCGALTRREVEFGRELRRVMKKTAPMIAACRTARAVAVDVFPSRTAWVKISVSRVRRDTPPRIAMTPNDVKQ